jgi:hypothetical protein
VHPHVGGCRRRASGALRHSVARRALRLGRQPERQAVRTHQHGLRHELLRARHLGRHRPRDLHDAQRIPVPGSRVPTTRPSVRSSTRPAGTRS